MTLPGETLATGAPHTCADCGTTVELAVMMSGAGFYVGSECGCGPYSRESGYFRDRAAAQAALDSGEFGR